MIAEIMAAFPSFNYEYILKKMTFKQFILWHMQALKIRYNIDPNLKETLNIQAELDKINEKLKWNEEKGRYE